MSAEGVPSLMELDRLRCEVEAVREALGEVEDRRRAAAVAAVRGGMGKLPVAVAAGGDSADVGQVAGRLDAQAEGVAS